MSRIVITDGIIYTGEEVIAPATLVVEGETIAQITPAGATTKDCRGTAAERDGTGTGLQEGDIHISASGKLVTPGLVNAHTHIYSALARGIALKDPPPTNFIENLERLWWRLDRALTLEEIDLSARLQAVECLRAGVTTIFDHHASQKAIRGSLPAISRAVAELGLRACLCFEVSDRDGVAAAREGIEENIAFINEVSAIDGRMQRAKFGLHASFTLSDTTLEACANASDPDSLGFHIHVAEDKIDQESTRASHALSVIERLKEVGVLGGKTLCVHGIDLDDHEIEILARSGVWLVHCPQSNMNNAVGAASLRRFQQAGLRVTLGTDGFAADVVREGLVAHLLQNHLSGDPGAGYATVRELPFGANAALAADTFGVDLGRLHPGNPADLVVWDYYPPTPLTKDNLWSHLILGLVGARAEDVFISGRHLLHKGKATTCDEIELRGRCTEAAGRLWDRF